jgi:hypothetical protein
MSMKYYARVGKYGFRPNFIIQYPDLNGVDRSVAVQFNDIARELANLPNCKVKGFWRVKWKDRP